jgi:catechol 2,3-dioxygenase-like lactoylglutathione lyase family enzyme
MALPRRRFRARGFRKQQRPTRRTRHRRRWHILQEQGSEGPGGLVPQRDGNRVEAWGGATLPTDAPGHPPVVVWSPFPADTRYMAPSTREFMVNFAVDDLDAFAARLAAKGVMVHQQPADTNGRFAWIVDPDGTKIELWQPKRP